MDNVFNQWFPRTCAFARFGGECLVFVRCYTWQFDAVEEFDKILTVVGPQHEIEEGISGRGKIGEHYCV